MIKYLLLFLSLIFLPINTCSAMSSTFVPDPNIELINAVESNSLDQVKNFIERRGGDVNYYLQYSHSSKTPLAVAVQQKNFIIAKYLLSKGADVNKAVIVNHTGLNLYKDTPLIMAIYNNDLDMVKLLIHNGADVNIVRKNLSILTEDKPKEEAVLPIEKYTIPPSGREPAIPLIKFIATDSSTPLLLAIDKPSAKNPPSLPLIKLLIKNGANVNQADENAYTPLMATANYSLTSQKTLRYEIAQILIKAGADPNTHDVNSKSPLQYAYENDFTQMVELLAKLAPR